MYQQEILFYSAARVDFIVIFNRGRSVVSWTLYG